MTGHFNTKESTLQHSPEFLLHCMPNVTIRNAPGERYQRTPSKWISTHQCSAGTKTAEQSLTYIQGI